MPSRPTLFDDDEFERHEPAVPPADDHGTSSGDPRPSEATRRPNYWFRRSVLIGGVVAVAAAAVLVVVNLRGSTTDTVESGAIDDDWNRIALTDLRSGRLVVANDQGEEVGRVESSVRPVDASRVVAATGLVVGTDGAAVVDLDSETADAIDLDDPSMAVPSGTALTMIAASSDGGRGVLVHGPSGDRLDTAEFAPLVGTRYEFATALSTPNGRTVLVTDSGNFQSVLLSFDRDEPSYVPDLALAVDDDVVVTGQNVGVDATVSVFDHDGELISSARTPSVRAGMVDDDNVVVVTVEGEVVTIDTGSGDTETTSRLEIGTVGSGAVAAAGAVLIVTGTDGTALVDSDGQVIATFLGRRPLDAAWSTRSGACVVLADEATGDLVAVDLSSGEVRAEAVTDSEPAASADGCTVAVEVDGEIQVVGETGATTIDTEGELVALAPDASAVVVDVDSRLLLTPIDAPDDTVDLGPSGRSVAFTDR